MAASSDPSADQLEELTDSLQDAFLTKMMGDEILSEEEEDVAENVSLTLAEKIIYDRGEHIYATVTESMNSPEEYRSWNITTWVIADWVLSKIGTGENPVDLEKQDNEGTHESWKKWIIGVETPYSIVKENGEFTDTLDSATSSAFTVTWIDVGTRDEPKQEAHMITVVGDQYYDTASLREADEGFHNIMTAKGYSRNEFISPFENFCTIWSWLFVLKVPSESEPGWEKRYIEELFEARPPLKKRRMHLRADPITDAMLEVLDNMLIKLRF